VRSAGARGGAICDTTQRFCTSRDVRASEEPTVLSPRRLLLLRHAIAEQNDGTAVL